MFAKKYHWIVVGAGFTGATFARARADMGDNVLLVEQRDHIGGNAYDYWMDGQLVSLYGPHLFHTNSKKVVEFLSEFTSWVSYEHHVKVEVDGLSLPMPINLNSIDQWLGSALGEDIAQDLIGCYGYGKTVNILKLLEDKKTKDLTFFADLVYKKLFEPYSKKQWGSHFKNLDPSVMGRVPIRINRDDRYFTDDFQMMPDQGYTPMFEKMLDHPNIQLLLNADYKEVIDDVSTPVFYTGSIDHFFDYEYGPLPYRTVDFQDVYSTPGTQTTATVNKPQHMLYTRTTNQSIINGSNTGHHIMTFEAAREHENVEDIRYYPIPTGDAQALYKRYELKAERHNENGYSVYFAGRLGSYSYLNMDQACAQGLQRAATLCHLDHP